MRSGHEQIDPDQAELMLYLAGELSDDRQREFDHRIMLDSELRAQLEMLRSDHDAVFRGISELDAADTVRSSAALERLVGRAIKQRRVEALTAPVQHVAVRHHHGWGWIHTAGVAASVLVGLVLWWGMHSRDNQIAAVQPQQPMVVDGQTPAAAEIASDDAVLEQAEQELQTERHCLFMRLLLVGAVGLSLTAAGAWAQATQPSPAAARRGGANPGRGNLAPSRGITREDRVQGENWTADNMPNLSRILGQLQPFNPRRIRLGNFAVNHMRAMEDAKKDPALLEKVKQTMKAEDEIFGYASQLDEAPAEEQPALRTKIREKMSSMLGDVFQEREKRIANLKARIEAEEKKLAEDKANMDAIVSARLRNMAIDPGQSNANPATPQQFNAMPNPTGN
jgi:hypothetical protein